MGTGKKPREGDQQPVERYEPPDNAQCVETNFPMDLLPSPDPDETHILQVAFRQYRGKVVHFSLEQVVEVGGVTSKITRVDTSDGELHRHRFTLQDQTKGTRTHLAWLEPRRHDVVDELFTEWQGRMLDEWEDNLRRWRGHAYRRP